MSEKILFIGGPKDGKREALPNNIGLHYQFAAFTSPRDWAAFTSPRDWAAFTSPRDWDSIPSPVADMSIGVTTETYHIKRFHDEHGGELKIAAHSSVKDVLQQLVKSYRYHRNPSRRYR